MAYGPQWKSLQVANPNVGGLLSTAQAGINNAGEAGRGVLTAYDEGQKLKNDALVAQELAGINSQEEFDTWLQNGGLAGRNVSGASIEAMMAHRQAMAKAAAASLAGAGGGSAPSGGSRSGSRSTGTGRRRSGSSSSSAPEAESGVSTDALLALALGQNPPATPVAGAPEPSVIRPRARPTTEVTPAGPAPFVPGATSTELDIPDLTSLSDDDLAAEIAALGG